MNSLDNIYIIVVLVYQKQKFPVTWASFPKLDINICNDGVKIERQLLFGIWYFFLSACLFIEGYAFKHVCLDIDQYCIDNVMEVFVV